MDRVRGIGIAPLFFIFLSCIGASQVPAKTSASPAASAERAATLAETGHCAEALPFLTKSIRQVGDRDLEKRIGLDGLHCAMTHNMPYASLDFLAVLGRDFPNDPEVLYSATHAYSDLSANTSNLLLREAPFSYQVHELNAEALEAQEKWDQTIVEYRGGNRTGETQSELEIAGHQSGPAGTGAEIIPALYTRLHFVRPDFQKQASIILACRQT